MNQDIQMAQANTNASEVDKWMRYAGKIQQAIIDLRKASGAQVVSLDISRQRNEMAEGV